MASAHVKYEGRLIGRIHDRAEKATNRNMRLRGIRVEAAAKRRISSYPRRVDTGLLRSSIHVSMFRSRWGWAARVGSGVEYALYVHNGTRYMIANPYLADALPAARG